MGLRVAPAVAPPPHSLHANDHQISMRVVVREQADVDDEIAAFRSQVDEVEIALSVRRFGIGAANVLSRLRLTH